MNIEAKNITATIRLIDNRVANVLKNCSRSTDRRPEAVSYSEIHDFKIYASALVDYCRLKYNDKVADFLNRYVSGRVDYINEAIEALDKKFVDEKAKEKLRAILTNSPGTADALIKSATSEEIIDLMNSWSDAKFSFFETNGSTCINIFYAKLNELCDKYNCTHSI